MRFAFYERLDEADRATYRKSEQIRAVRLHRPGEFQPLARALADELASGDLERVTRAAQRLLDALTERLRVPRLEVFVLPERPRDAHGGELHGFYAKLPLLTVWMRTARHRRVVAFKTFLRTLLHELCHHLDFELFRLPQSFHTAGFFQRESSLFHQLVPPPKKNDPGALLPGLE